MGVLRKAGVWLGLVEDDEGYDEPAGNEWSEGSVRDRARSRRRYTDDEFGDEDELGEPVDRGRDPERSAGERLQDAERARDLEDLPPATRNRLTERVAQRRAEREGRREPDNVRSITRDATVSYLTHDNLALAPEVHEPEPSVAREEERRYQITTLHPTSYREARTIGEHFREGTPVIMNLTEMDEADARRLVDFGAGLAFGLRGNMERVTNRVFLLSPANVQVTAEDKAKIAEGGFFHQR
jgi:cell division inhibitor SepF